MSILLLTARIVSIRHRLKFFIQNYKVRHMCKEIILFNNFKLRKNILSLQYVSYNIVFCLNKIYVWTYTELALLISYIHGIRDTVRKGIRPGGKMNACINIFFLSLKESKRLATEECWPQLCNGMQSSWG